MEALNSKSFGGLSGRALEESIDYQLMYKPHDGFVGDTIPYYEDGTFYIFYLKDQGDSYNHSIFLVETKDFLHYEDRGEVIRASSDLYAQDNWVGTGSICKVGNTYYFFYTGHNKKLKVQEKVLVATSEGDLYHFRKLKDVSIEPLGDLSHVDFRDPEANYDADNDEFILTVTTNSPSLGKVIVKYRVSRDCKTYRMDGTIFSDRDKGDAFAFNFYNFECSDMFKIGAYWYLSFSCQDDTLWVVKSQEQYAGYDSGSPYRLDGKFFYVPKTVSDGKNVYVVGWARGREDCCDNGNGMWGGNLLVSKVMQKQDGTLYLSPIDGLDGYFNKACSLNDSTIKLSGQESVTLCKASESFGLSGDFCFMAEGEFGFEFSADDAPDQRGKVRFEPAKGKVEHTLLNNKKKGASLGMPLTVGKTYHFDLVFEGSVCVAYIAGEGALTCRFYDKLASNVKVYANGGDVTFFNLQCKVR